MTVSDACKTTYEEIKKDKKHRYVVFYIRDEKQIDVETVGERNAEYDQFLEDLQKGGTGECRYVTHTTEAVAVLADIHIRILYFVVLMDCYGAVNA